ncbi:MAG: hypothetical protein ACI9EW_004002 [Cellvibrionaceae bacterium]|jgi:hypothetical protein
MLLDNVSLITSPEKSCKVVGDISWLNVSPGSGTLSPGSTDLIVSFDSTGLPVGTYTDTLCVNSNDPDEPTIEVPVQMEVIGIWYLPIIAKN